MKKKTLVVLCIMIIALCITGCNKDEEEYRKSLIGPDGVYERPEEGYLFSKNAKSGFWAVVVVERFGAKFATQSAIYGVVQELFGEFFQPKSVVLVRLLSVSSAHWLRKNLRISILTKGYLHYSTYCARVFTWIFIWIKRWA